MGILTSFNPKIASYKSTETNIVGNNYRFSEYDD